MSTETTVRKGPGILLTAAGTAIVGGIALLANVAAGYSTGRIDMTANKVHTLTEGTKNILSKVKTPTKITYYYTAKGDLPPNLASFAPVIDQVESYIIRICELNPGKVTYVKKAVEQASDEFEEAVNAGIEPQQGSLFCGVQVKSLDDESIIPWVPQYLANNGKEDDQIEYALAKAITEVTKKSRRKVGVLSALPVKGSGGGPAMMMQQQKQPAWAVYEELKATYDVTDIELSQSALPEGLDALLLVHPAGISDELQYSIDQYILKGGRVVAYLDANSLSAANQPGSGPPGMGGGGGVDTASNLSRLLSSWGYTFDTSNIIADPKTAVQISQDSVMPVLMNLGPEAVPEENRGDAVMKGLTNFFAIYAGGFAGSPASGLQQKVYLQTTGSQAMVPVTYASANPGSPDSAKQMKELLYSTKMKAEGLTRPLAFRLSGKFKTAFPDGKPAAKAAPPAGGGSQGPEGEPGTAAPAAAPAAPSVTATTATPPIAVPAPPEVIPAAAPGSVTATSPTILPVTAAPGPAAAAAAPAAPVSDGSLKEGVKEGMVYLVADSDMLFDQVGPIKQSGNIVMALGMIDEATGDTDLMQVRSRGSSMRPFTTLNAIQEDANKKIRDEVKSMQEQVDQVSATINSAKTNKERNQAIMATMKAAQLEQNKLRKLIWEKQKQARKEYEGIVQGMKLKTVLYPLLFIAIAGLAVLFVRKSSTAAH